VSAEAVAPKLRPTEALRATFGLLHSALDGFITGRLALALGFMIIASALLALTPVLYKLLIDALTVSPPAQTLPLLLIGGYVLAQGLARVVGELRTWMHGQGAQRLMRRLSTRLFDHIVRLPLRYHLDRKTGAVAETLSQGLAGCQLLLQYALFTVLPIAIEFTTVLIVLLHFQHLAYLLIFIPAAIGYFVFFRRAALNVMAPARASSAAQIEARAVLADSLLNYETVKYFSAEPLIGERYDTALTQAESAWRRLLSVRTLNSLSITLVFTLSLAAALGCAAYEVVHGTMSAGDFVLIATYVVSLAQPLETLGYAFRDLAQGLAFLEKMLQLLAEPTEEDCLRAPPGALPAPGLLSFEQVSFSYQPQRQILNDVSFTLQPGRTLAIVGVTGSGKSSIIRLLFRLYEAGSGRVLLDGVPITQLPLATLRGAIAVVPQDTVLFNDTLYNNIRFGNPQASTADIERVARLARLDELIALLPQGYETRVGERGLKISGGEKQRVAIARAALKAPRIYVFDEATSALDSRTERQILENLRDLAQHSTTLIIAHRLSTTVHADEIVVLQHATVVERGTHAELLKRNGHYAELWRAQHGGSSSAGAWHSASVP
jgi:ATP-binding cassette subfamily B protein